MQICNLFLFLLLELCPRLLAHAVVDLTEYTLEEFNLELQNHESIFVKFYTPSCPHCKAIASDFALVARQMRDQDEAVVLAEVDCGHDAGEEICSKHGVIAYPTLKLFRYGSFYKNYNKQRDAKTMKKWLMNQVQGSSKIVSSIRELQTLVQSSNEVTVSAVVKSGQTKLLSFFLKASKKVKQHPQFADLQFYHVITDDLPTVWGAFSSDKTPATVTLRRPKWLQSILETEKVSIPLTLKRNLTDWVFNQTYGLVVHRTPKTDRNVYDPRNVGPLVVTYYEFDIRNDYNATHFWRDQLLPFAKEYPRLVFAISRSTDYSYYLKTKSLPVPQQSDPPVVILYDHLTVPYAMNQSFTPAALRKFLDTRDQSQYVPRLRSSSICPDNANWTLPCITALDVNDRVSLSHKGIFLVVYKQVNAESIKLVMKVSQFCSKIDYQNQVEGFTLDASLNEVPHAFESPDYPVIFYVSANKKILKIDRKITDAAIAEMFRLFALKSSKKPDRVKYEL